MRDLMQEEASFRRELSDSLKQSNDNFLKAMDSFNKTISQLGNGLCISIDMLARAMYMSNQATQNQNMYFPNNIPNVHPIAPRNISKNVPFSRPDSYVSYADWLNESQGQENWTIEENFFVAIFVAIYVYIWTSLNRG